MEDILKTINLDKYNVLGFDLDHTICSYKLDNLSKMLYSLLADYLIKVKKYDASYLLKPYEAEKDFIQKGLVLDKARGNILKLSKDYKIIKGYHGTKQLTKGELSNIYGENLVWEAVIHLEEVLGTTNYRTSPFYVFIDYFVTFGSLICARIIDSLDANTPQSNYTFWNDVYDGLTYLYTNETPGAECKNYFEVLKANPSAYIQPCSEETKMWLKQVGKYKKMFLLTNSDIDYASYISNHCLGNNWKTYFDIILTSGQKPSFFRSSSNFIEIQDIYELRKVTKEDLTSFKVYSQGNWKDFHFYLNKMTEPCPPKILYFGDSLAHDVIAPSVLTDCHTAAIVEEHIFESKSSVKNPHSLWGSFFLDIVIENDNPEEVNTLWNTLIKKHSQFSIPSLHSLALASQGKKLW